MMGPAVDLAFAAGEEFQQVGPQVGPEQRVYRLQALAVVRHQQRGAGTVLRGDEAGDVIGREPRAVAGQRQHPRRCDRRHRAGETGQRPLKIAQLVADHGIAEFGIARLVAVGIDQDIDRLPSQLLDQQRHQRLAVEFDQSLVLPAHTPTLTAGENHRGYVPCLNRHRLRP